MSYEVSIKGPDGCCTVRVNDELHIALAWAIDDHCIRKCEVLANVLTSGMVEFCEIPPEELIGEWIVASQKVADWWEKFDADAAFAHQAWRRGNSP